MRSETQQAHRRRRGGRRPRDSRDSRDFRSSREGREPSGASTPSRISKTPAKKGFFQRLLGLFIKSKPQNPGNIYGSIPGHSGSPAPARSNGRGSAPAASATEGRKPNGSNTANGEPQRSRSVRKPELVEVTSPKLYVGNLSFDATESDLSELFAGVGSVQNAEVVSHRESQKSKGFAFVTMSNTDEAKRAVVELHDKEFMGRRLVVSGAKTNDVRDVR